MVLKQIFTSWGLAKTLRLHFNHTMRLTSSKAVRQIREEQVYNFSKALVKPLAIPLGKQTTLAKWLVMVRQLAIPLIRQKSMDKRLVIVAAAIAVFFSLNAMAAGIASTANDTPAAGPSAKPEERYRNQQDIRQEMRDHWENMSPEEREQVRNKMKDHWKNMSPEEREARRKEMREHFKNMTPEEREQFDRDLGKQNGMPPPDGDYLGGNTGNAGRPVK